MRFESSKRRLEGLASDGGQAVDTLCGRIFRLFARVERLDEVCTRLTSRIAALETGRSEAAIPVTESPPGGENELIAALKRSKRRSSRSPFAAQPAAGPAPP